MIQIVNIGGDPFGVCSYLLKINDHVKCEFTHDRTKGLSQCLRDAADAYDQKKRLEFWERNEKREGK